MCQSENIYSDKHKKHCTPWVFMLSRVVYTSTCLYLSIRLVFNVYRPTVFSGSRACSATLFAVSRWKRACSRTENYGEECKDEGSLKILLGVFIVFVKATLKNLSLHFPDEPNLKVYHFLIKKCTTLPCLIVSVHVWGIKEGYGYRFDCRFLVKNI